MGITPALQVLSGGVYFLYGTGENVEFSMRAGRLSQQAARTKELDGLKRYLGAFFFAL